MQTRARVTSKGQVTVPVGIRRQYGIRAGDDLYFERRGDEILVQVVHRRPLAELFGALPAPAPFPDLETVAADVRATVAADVLDDRSTRGSRDAAAGG